MSKTKDKYQETYKKEREPRSHKRKIEEERIKEVPIPPRTQLDTLLSIYDVPAHSGLTDKEST